MSLLYELAIEIAFIKNSTKLIPGTLLLGVSREMLLLKWIMKVFFLAGGAQGSNKD